MKDHIGTLHTGIWPLNRKDYRRVTRCKGLSCTGYEGNKSGRQKETKEKVVVVVVAVIVVVVVIEIEK